MASLLDILKAKGIDPTSFLSDKRDESDETPPDTGMGASLASRSELTPEQIQSAVKASTDNLAKRQVAGKGWGSDSLQSVKFDPKILPGSSDEDEDNSDEQPEPSPKVSSPASSTSNNFQPNKIQALQDSLLQKSPSDIRNTQNLADAQKMGAQNQLFANLLGASNQIGAGFASLGSGSNVKPQGEEGVKQLQASANAPVTLYTQQTAAQKSDPNSDLSKQMRATFKQVFGKNLGENYSAEDIEKIMPQMSHLEGIKEQAAARKEVAQQNALLRQAAQQDKQSKAENDAFYKVSKDIESFRGNAGAQQASRDLLSADKALAIVKNKDPNSLTTQDLQLLSSEMAKIAAGGVPGEHGVQALLPNNLNTKLAEMQNFLSSNPTDANAGAYIKKNMSYLQDMRDIASKTLGDYQSKIAKGAKHQLSPARYKELLDNIQQSNLAPSSPSVSQGKIKVSDGKQTFMIDPNDLDHAKADGFNPVK